MGRRTSKHDSYDARAHDRIFAWFAYFAVGPSLV